MLFLSLALRAACSEAACPLSFREDRSFTVLVVADPQDTDQPRQAMLDLLNASLDAACPDLVVFLGDQIHGPAVHGEERVRAAMEAVLQPVVRRGLPFAVVFGNHDDECGMSREELLDFCRSQPGCLAVEGEALPGCGNYFLLIENPLVPQSPLVLWFLDSGSYAEEGRGTYGYVTEEQNEWMLRESSALKDRYGAPVSFVFQHIPVPQVYEMLVEVPFGTKGAVTCYGPNFLKWYLPGPGCIWAGELGEGPCSSEYDSGEFLAWQEMGVRAAFFGHDHLNSYCGTWDGVDLIATPGIGFYMYGPGENHGARTVTFNAEQPAAYKTEVLLWKDVVNAPLPGLFVSSLGVMLQRYVFLGAAALLAAIVLLVQIIRRRRKRRRYRNPMPS